MCKHEKKTMASSEDLLFACALPHVEKSGKVALVLLRNIAHLCLGDVDTYGLLHHSSRGGVTIRWTSYPYFHAQGNSSSFDG